MRKLDQRKEFASSQQHTMTNVKLVPLFEKHMHSKACKEADEHNESCNSQKSECKLQPIESDDLIYNNESIVICKYIMDEIQGNMDSLIEVEHAAKMAPKAAIANLKG